LIFFRKEVNFFDRLFFNKLVFFNYPSFWVAPAIYSLGRDFFINDYLRLKISEYSFSSFVRFKFFEPFGFVSFLNRIYELAYHFKYKKDFPLFESVHSIEVIVKKEKEKLKEKDIILSFNVADLFDAAKFNRFIAEVKRRDTFSKDFRSKIRPISFSVLRSFFSRSFLKGISFFRKRFFFSFFNNFRFKFTNFFQFHLSHLENVIEYLKRSIYLKFFLFFSRIKRFSFSKFFFVESLKKYYYNFFKLSIYSKTFFFKKKMKLLRDLVFLKAFFKNLFFLKNKKVFLKFFYF
jgi:hypothetical protein